MGLSLSGTAAVVFIGGILIFGTLYPTIRSSTSIVEEAKEEWSDFKNEKIRSNVEIESIKNTSYTNVTMNNTGDSVLDIRELEILINGEYSTERIVNSTVEENKENTNIWAPDQELTLTLDLEMEENEIERVTVVDEYGNTYYEGV